MWCEVRAGIQSPKYGGINQTFGPAYPEGLVWKTSNIHPGGAKPTGYGTWAFPPKA